jgi:hypothetical protein
VIVGTSRTADPLAGGDREALTEREPPAR